MIVDIRGMSDYNTVLSRCIYSCSSYIGSLCMCCNIMWYRTLRLDTLLCHGRKWKVNS